ncbi:putative flagellar hook-length control protein [Legionella birminghamensis]|uniref:Flagellar hook-length control protein n=1 Tax=Legionella birminghamensis TaxID=28083 RepID=A0A378I8I5_9GAMM|nr:flagellar hook-length control protein FliK [Legionella birminghamensis]KTC69266.1 putative flagellar hook-length control protein [Legionella birminghamensis]STX31528.1 flagellar hook-length control protein FliK [Legionella birminghamensis]
MINQVPADNFILVPETVSAEAVDEQSAGISNFFLELITQYLSDADPEVIQDSNENEVILASEQDMATNSEAAIPTYMPFNYESQGVEISEKEEQDELTLNPALAWLTAASYEPPTRQELQSIAISNAGIEIATSNESQSILKEGQGLYPVSVESNGQKLTVRENPALLTANFSEDEPGSDSEHIAIQTRQPDEESNKIADVSERVFEPEQQPVLIENTTLRMKTDFEPFDFKNQLSNVKMNHFELPTKVHDAAWQDEFNGGLVWLSQHKINQAVLKLNPVELGPVEVKIHLAEEAATIDIKTHNLQVRDLIEQSLPRLREMLMDRGLQLAEVNIETGDRRSHSHTQAQQNEEAAFFEEEQTPVVIQQKNGIVDYFA